jgi:probable F420-dependent oxidoreductase
MKGWSTRSKGETVKLGFAVPVSGSWATPSNQVEVARLAEQLGYSSLWTFQRLLYPDEPGGEPWPVVYRSVVDPLITLGFLAGQTSHIRLGAAVVNAPFYSPIVLAKQLATLDLLSEGRLDAGLGLGWSPEEFQATGAGFEDRGRRMDDFLRCLQAVLRDDPVEYRGEFYCVPRSHVDPKPVQKPWPPILIGANGERALRRAGRLADGWISSSRADLQALGASTAIVREAAQAAGRDETNLRFICRATVKVRPQRAGLLSGSFADIAADIEAIAAQGMTELFIDLNFDPEIGSIEADPAASMRRAEEVLREFAPAAAERTLST